MYFILKSKLFKIYGCPERKSHELTYEIEQKNRPCQLVGCPMYRDLCYFTKDVFFFDEPLFQKLNLVLNLAKKKITRVNYNPVWINSNCFNNHKNWFFMRFFFQSEGSVTINLQREIITKHNPECLLKMHRGHYYW